ncbi:EAL domain-containing protein [Porticoccus sp. W117]|uniref:EAL domain-containing protein n=1 Tax=Porticoccus sp. W117 TaxID=3054777 RepID=UPI00259856C1|nr:EAL domain-containing protein [Porticoccus sp. W117]MDM3870205.1 EAL domain-containing protein [Porticoccus sp. W117]
MKLPKQFCTLRWRIFISFFLLLLGLQWVTLTLTYKASRENLDQTIRSQLLAAQRLFDSEWQSSNQYLQRSVDTIAKDWSFREAVGSDDPDTISSVLLNHSGRIAADVALFTDLDGNPVAQAGKSIIALGEAQRTLMQQSLNSQVHLVHSNNGFYRLVLAPVKLPLPVGWVGMAFAIDDNHALQFKQLTNLDTSYLYTGGATPTPLATTLPITEDSSYSSLLTSVVRNAGTIVNVGGSLALLEPMPDADSPHFQILLSQPLEPLLSGFRSQWMELIVLLIVGALLTVAVAYFVARSITNPVQQLLQAIGNVGTGNYSSVISVTGSSEINALSEEFNHMQRKVALREQEIVFRASHDSITGLYNQAGFLRAVEQQLKFYSHGSAKADIVVLEVKRLQDVKHTLGHSLGDKLLKQISEQLQEISTQIVLCYLGNDSFAAFVPQTRQAGNALEAMLNQFKHPFQLQGISILLGAQAGVARYPEHGDAADALLRFAEIALNEATEKRAPWMLYDPEHDSHSVFRLALLHELSNAIKNDQLELHYQPKLEIRNGLEGARPTQVEALVRWIHPEHGFVGPDQFIPAAEQSGLITELTEWVIDKAIQQSKSWQQQGIDLKVAVNISAADLLSGDLTKVVSERLQAHGVAPARLVLEVTESAVVEDPEKAVALLNRLKIQGVGLSVDDYGTGYSSLAQLKQLPVHELKIDREFISEIAANTSDALIVQSTINLGHRMGMVVTAEGIEDEASLKMLERFSCDFAQGYFISKPLPAAQLEQWWQEHYGAQPVESKG